MTPSRRASAKPIDGRSAFSSNFSNSPQMRSAGRSSSEMARQMASLSGSIVSSNRAANCTARSRRSESSANVSGIDDAQDAASEILAAVEGVEILVGERIPTDRVDREVAPPRRLLERHERVALRRRSPCVRILISIRGGEARRRCGRACRRETPDRSARRVRTPRAARAGAPAECRRSRDPGRSIRHQAVDREQTRRRTARGRPRPRRAWRPRALRQPSHDRELSRGPSQRLAGQDSRVHGFTGAEALE